jgi:hypothetical protein
MTQETLSATQQAMPTQAPHSNGNGGGQAGADIQSRSAAAVPDDFPGAKHETLPIAHPRRGTDNGGGHSAFDTHELGATAVPSLHLRLAADTLADVERLRIATENRTRALYEIPGWALTPAAVRWELHLSALHDLEEQVTRELQQAMRAHPLGPWVRSTVGLGLKQMGRLIGAIGDASWNTLEDRPRRGPAELWAYCGYVPGQRRRKGERSNWNAEAKMRAFLVAESCVKQRGSPYRKVYDDARAKYAGTAHDEPCVRCGPQGKPAPAGSPLSLGHQHARALRVVAKAVLRDMWREAVRIREGA